MAWIRACGGGSPAVPDGKTVTPINDVTIWQKCAGIANPTYTTLSDVLADTGVLSTLIASDNAVDYLVRSTTFASDVCSNANAMTYIGQNNYASDTLLADSDWRDAICNSTYFESVLNVKVPVMTSNTAPKGVASASSVWNNNENFYAWRAFNNANSSIWLGGKGQTSGWIQYMFEDAIDVHKIYLYYPTVYGSVRSINSVTLKASNDGSSFTTLMTDSAPGSSVTKNYLLNNNTKYKYYRLEISGYNNYDEGYYAISVSKLQFYGREDV